MIHHGGDGTHVPIPLKPRVIRERATPRGFAWPTPTGPDPDAIARLVAAGLLTVTPEVIDEKPVKVVRRARGGWKPTEPRALKRDAVTGTPRANLDEPGIVAAYKAGATIKGLAREHHVVPMTIRMRLIHLGVEIRSTPGAGGRRKVDTNEVVQLRGEGMTQAAIARRLGCSERAVRNHLTKAKGASN